MFYGPSSFCTGGLKSEGTGKSESWPQVNSSQDLLGQFSSGPTYLLHSYLDSLVTVISQDGIWLMKSKGTEF